MGSLETASSFGVGVGACQRQGEKGGAIFKGEDGGKGSCKWTVVIGWQFLVVPLWKSVKNGLN